MTGALVWNFDPANPDTTQPIQKDQQYLYDSPVAWSTFTADSKNGLVYIPFGNASPDLLGLDRDMKSHTEKFRDSLVALDLQTGQLKWSFQTSKMIYGIVTIHHNPHFWILIIKGKISCNYITNQSWKHICTQSTDGKAYLSN